MAVNGNQEFVIKITADTSKARDEFLKFINAATAAGGGVTKASASVKEGVKGFESLEGKLVAVEAAFGALEVASEIMHKIAESIEEPVKLAAQMEQNNARLATSLKLAGQGSEEALAGIEDFAAGLQKTAGVNEELIKRVVATNVAIGMTIPQAEEAAHAAASLAKFTGTDLVNANEELLASLESQAKALAKVSPAVKGLTVDQLRHGEAIKIVNKQLGEFATADAQTALGVLDRLKLGWEDLQKQVGTYILTGLNAKGNFEALSGALTDLGTFLTDNKQQIIEFARVLATDAVATIKEFAAQAKDLGPVLVGMGKQFGDLTKYFMIPFAEVIVSISSILAHFQGNQKLEDSLDHLMDKLKKTFETAHDSLNGINSSPAIDWDAKLNTTGFDKAMGALKPAGGGSFADLYNKTYKTPASAPVAAGSSVGSLRVAEDIHKDTGPINLPMTQQQKAAQLAAQRGLDDQRLAIEASYGDQLTAAHEATLRKLAQAEQDAKTQGINITKQDAALRLAIEQKYLFDKQRLDRANSLQSAQLVGDVVATNKAQYAVDVQNAADAYRRGVFGQGKEALDKYADAVAEAGKKQVNADRDFKLQIAQQTEDLFGAAQLEYDKNVSAYQDMLNKNLINDKQFQTAVDAANLKKKVAEGAATEQPANNFVAATSVDTALPMLGAVDKMVGAIQGLLDFIPNLLNKIAGIFQSIRDLPTKLGEAVANILNSVLSMISNFGPNVMKMVDKIITSAVNFVTKLPDILANSMTKMPDLIAKFIQKIPQFVSALVTSGITQMPKLVVGMITAMVQGIPAVWHALVDAAKSLPGVIIQAFKEAFKEIKQLFSGLFSGAKMKLPDFAPQLAHITQAIKGSASQLFNVADFKTAAKNVDIGDKVRDAINSSMLNLAKLLGALWNDLVAGIKKVWQWVWDNTIKPMVDLTKKAWGWVYDNVIGPIETVVKRAWQWVWDNTIQPMIDATMKVWKWVDTNVIQPMVTSLETVWNDFKVIGQFVGNLFSTAWSNLKSIGSSVAGSFSSAWDTLKSVGSGVATLFTSAWDIFKNVGKGIADLFGGNWKDLSKVGDSLKATFDKVTGAFSNVWDTIKAGFQKVFGPILDWKFPSFNWPEIHLPDLSIPKPSWLSAGGIVNRAEGVVQNIGKSITNSGVGQAVSSVASSIGKAFSHWEGGGEVHNGMLYAAQGTDVRGTDTVPAMLTAGEYVVNRHAVGRVGIPALDKINSGQGVGGGGIVLTAPITINTTQPIDQNFIRSKLVPTLMEAIKRESQNGKYILSTKGLRSV